MYTSDDITAVIPLYNKEKFITRALISIISQHKKPKQIIVIDDGSRDSSASVVEQIAKTDPTITLVKKNNEGVSVARNKGAELANTKFVAFLDADDEWKPHFITEALSLINQEKSCSVFCFRHSRVDIRKNTILSKVSLPANFRGEVKNFIETYSHGYGIIHSSAVVIDRKTIFLHGGFPPGAKKSQDIYLWLKLGLKEKIAYSDRECTLRHDDGSGVHLRSDSISYHIQAFTTFERQAVLDSNSLKRFLKKNIITMVLAEKMAGNYGNAIKISKSSFKLGLTLGLCTFLLAQTPSNLIKKVRSLKN